MWGSDAVNCEKQLPELRAAHNSPSPPSVTRVIVTKRMTQAHHVVCKRFQGFVQYLVTRSDGQASLGGLVSFTNFNAQFLYSLTICMLHYNPRDMSRIVM